MCNKEPGIGVLCNKGWHPTTVQPRGGREAHFSKLLTSNVFSLQISLCPHCLCRPSFALLCPLMCSTKTKRFDISNVLKLLLLNCQKMSENKAQFCIFRISINIQSTLQHQNVRKTLPSVERLPGQHQHCIWKLERGQ